MGRLGLLLRIFYGSLLILDASRLNLQSSLVFGNLFICIRYVVSIGFLRTLHTLYFSFCDIEYAYYCLGLWEL